MPRSSVSMTIGHPRVTLGREVCDKCALACCCWALGGRRPAAPVVARAGVVGVACEQGGGRWCRRQPLRTPIWTITAIRPGHKAAATLSSSRWTTWTSTKRFPAPTCRLVHPAVAGWATWPGVRCRRPPRRPHSAPAWPQWWSAPGSGRRPPRAGAPPRRRPLPGTRIGPCCSIRQRTGVSSTSWTGPACGAFAGGEIGSWLAGSSRPVSSRVAIGSSANSSPVTSRIDSVSSSAVNTTPHGPRPPDPPATHPRAATQRRQRPNSESGT
jgi:hypothetical protein